MPNPKSPAPMSVEEADPYAAFIAGAQFCIELSEGVITPADVMPEVLAEAECRFPVPDSHLLDTGDEVNTELEPYKRVYQAACDWFNFGPPHQIDETDPGSIVTKDGNYEPFTQALEDAVSAIDASSDGPGPVPSTGDEEIKRKELYDRVTDMLFEPPVPDTEKVKTEGIDDMEPLEDLVREYAQEYWASDRTVSREEDRACEVAMAGIMKAIHQHVAALVQAEREACAKIALKHLCPAHPLGIGIPDAIAKEIRDRSSTGISNE